MKLVYRIVIKQPDGRTFFERIEEPPGIIPQRGWKIELGKMYLSEIEETVLKIGEGVIEIGLCSLDFSDPSEAQDAQRFMAALIAEGWVTT